MKVKTVEEGFCIKDEAKGVGIKAYLVDLSPNVCVYKNGQHLSLFPFAHKGRGGGNQNGAVYSFDKHAPINSNYFVPAVPN